MSDYRLVTHRGRWSIAFQDGERGRVRIALGTDDRGLAEARARDIWAKRHAAPTERVEDLWKAYIADRRQDEVKDLSRIEHAWKAMAPHFGHRLGSAINAQDCRDYAAARKREGRAASTIRTELEYLRACLNKHYPRGAVKMWLPPASKPRERWLTRAEVDRLLEAIETPHVRLFVILALTTGARASAILELTWDRVRLDAATPTVDFQPAGRHATNKRRIEVPLNRRAMEALREARQAAMTDHVIEFAGRHVGSVKKAIGSAARRSGVPCSPHVFRHTAGVWLAHADQPMDKIAQFLGHTSSRVTYATYARYSPSFMRDSATVLEF